MTETEGLVAILELLCDRHLPPQLREGTRFTALELHAAREILSLRKQLATKDELIQSQRGLIEETCKREAEAQQRMVDLERELRENDAKWEQAWADEDARRSTR